MSILLIKLKNKTNRLLKNQYLTVPLLAGFISLLIISFIFLLVQITPFGEKNLLFSDVRSQYVPLLTYFKKMILNHNLQLYSFSLSLGDNNISNLAYYLMSPFNFIILLFPNSEIPIGVSIIIILKIACLAVTTTYFLQKHFQTKSLQTSLFGIIFSLSGFVAMNYYNLMWLDTLIILPIVVLGLEKLVYTKSSWLYFFALWLSIVVNFYLAYMVCLFLFFYFLYLLSNKYADIPLRKAIIKHPQIIFRFFIISFLSVGFSCFILLPTVIQMLHSTKSSHFLLRDFLLKKQFGLSFLSQLGIGANNFSNRMNNFHKNLIMIRGPVIFATSYLYILVFSFFFNKKIKRKKRQISFIFLLGLFFSMWFRPTDTIWHLFHHPVGFSFREAFLFIFLLVILACESFLNNPKSLSFPKKIFIPLLLSLVLIIGWINSQFSASKIPYKYLIISLIFVFFSALLLYSKRLNFSVCLYILVIIELMLNFRFSLNQTPFGNQKLYQENYLKESQKLKSIPLSQRLARTEDHDSILKRAYKDKTQGYNEPILFGIHSISYYSSTLNQNTLSALNALGLFSKNPRRISSQGLNPVSEMLAGIKYKTKNEAKMGENPYFVGSGFAIPKSFSKIKMSSKNSLKNQEKILQSLYPINEKYYQSPLILKKNITYQKNYPNTKYPYFNHLFLKVKTNGPLYYEDLSGNSFYSSFIVNGKKISKNIWSRKIHHYLLFKLGNFKKGDIVNINYHAASGFSSTRPKIQSLQLKQFKKVVQLNKRVGFNLLEKPNKFKTKLKGAFNNKSPYKRLYISLPYDTNWQIKVNGKNVNGKKVLGGLLSIPIKSHHKNIIQISYRIPGLKLGILISFISLIFYIFFLKKRTSK